MKRFEVKQEQEDLWSVSSQGCTLYFYSSEEEARWAALMLAADDCEAGTQAAVVFTPGELGHSHPDSQGGHRFTGM
jgi:hypothetical protein